MKIEAHYLKARRLFRVYSFLVDLTLIIVTSLILVTIGFLILNNASFYINANSDIKEIRLDSKLYIEDDENVLPYSEYIESLDEPITSKNELIDEVLTYFYKEYLGDIDIYNDLKLDKVIDNTHLFIEVNDEVLVNENSGISSAEYYNFYIDTLNNNAIGYLLSNYEFIRASRTILISIFINILISIIISSLIYYMIIPLLSFTNHSTIGMKIFKIGYINSDALAIKTYKYFLISLFNFFIMDLLSLFTLFIPLIISFSFFLFRKDSKSLTDYLFNVNKINIEKGKIFKTIGEYVHYKNIESKKFLDSDSPLN